MPRGPRLDAPGVLHHGMGRGLERCAIFRDVRDRAACRGRQARLVAASAVTVYAWPFLPNHAASSARLGQRPWPGACEPS